MANDTKLTLDTLREVVQGGVAAIRSVSRLQPVGGAGDKVFPPSYAVDDKAPTKYATETRRLDGQEVACVLLDSVPSQANRMEEALLEAWRDGDIPLSVVEVDFSGQEGLEDLEHITSLDAPHRIADALLRDSLYEGQLFRNSQPGQAFTDARVTHASSLYHYCPTALVFGIWDSTGPKGGLGAKFPRALVSEIIGVGVDTGVKTASRIDPAAIQRVPVYMHATEEWTADGEQAVKEKGQPVAYNRKGQGKGVPSAVNHGNIAPSIDDRAGGVTMDYALQTTVLSLPGLRRLRFQTTTDGKKLEGESRTKAENAARTALAALALAAVSLHRSHGYDLRSRCALVPEGPLTLELVPAEGGEPRRVTLSPDDAKSLLRAAVQDASEHGMRWLEKPVTLTPAPKLVQLIRRSRELAATGAVVEAD